MPAVAIEQVCTCEIRSNKQASEKRFSRQTVTVRLTRLFHATATEQRCDDVALLKVRRAESANLTKIEREGERRK